MKKNYMSVGVDQLSELSLIGFNHSPFLQEFSVEDTWKRPGAYSNIINPSLKHTKILAVKFGFTIMNLSGRRCQSTQILKKNSRFPVTLNTLSQVG